MLIFNDYARSPNCLKTKILLLELGIPFERRIVDVDVLRGPTYRAKFPSGLAPSIEEDGLLLSESQAIAFHLVEKHGRFLPSRAERRAQLFQALSFESALLAPTIGAQGYFGELYKPEGERNEKRLAELRTKVQHVVHTLATILGDKPYFAEEYSIADMQLYPALAKGYAAGLFESPAAPLVAWIARMSEKPTVQRARQDYVGYRVERAA
jgi:GST-like protein